MAREKRFTTEQLYDIIHKFYQEKKHLSVKMNFSNLADFARDELKIMDINYYHFSRNKEINNKIKEFNRTLKSNVIEYAADNSSFATLNIKGFVKTYGNNPERLTFLLTNLQEMQRKLYNRTIEAELKVKELEQKLEEETLKKAEYKSKYQELKLEANSLKQDIKTYKDALGIQEESQLVNALNSTGLYLIEKSNSETSVDLEYKNRIKQLDDSNGKNLEKLLDDFEDLFD